jgi:thymidylate synthase|tara:strand:- start:856 stop:1779 length:924 start_codon:yes stop_codon:yes gene_type:complete
MNKLDQQYQTLLNNILEYGVEKSDRTGTGTQSIFGYTIRHNMSEGFPLITTKKMAIKTMMTELKWFLKGDTNIKYLVKNNCNIWNGDAYKNYLNTYKGNWVMNMKEFVESIKNSDDTAKMYGDLGPIYGKQWRRWETDSVSIDQIQNLINELKTNPDSRRLMVNAWNVSELGEMTLPPCHYGFQVYTRPTTREEKITNPGKYRAISLMWNQRSVDTGLGLPFNIASYGALLTLIGHEVNMIPDVLIGSFGDTHLYKDHLDGAREQMERVSFDLPTIEFTNVNLLEGEFDYEVKDYQYHPTIKFSLSN